MNTKNKVETYLSGLVVKKSGEKTVAVEVERIYQHPVYKKTIRAKKKFLAHDPENRCEVGDSVKIKGVRPISKSKRWLVVDVVKLENREVLIEGDKYDSDAN
jgi:small subunit ribosomal protein S17